MIKKLVKTDFSHLFIIYTSILLLCIVAFCIGISMLATSAIQNKKQDFIEFANAQYLHAASTMKKQDAILNGLTAYLDTQEQLKLEELKVYSDKILIRHPEVYQIQFAHFFPNSLLNTQETLYQEQNSNFGVKIFDPTQGLIKAPKDMPWYVPIVYVAAREKIPVEQTGLDLKTIPFIYEAIEQAIKLENRSALSIPFENFEGDQVIVMMQQSEGLTQSDEIFFAFIIVDTQILLNQTQYKKFPTNVAIYLGEEITEDSLLLTKQQPNNESKHFLSFNLPSFNYHRDFILGDKQINVEFSYQLDPSIFDYRLFGLFIGLFVILMIAFIGMFFNRLKVEKLKASQSQELYQLANFDNVTQLANRNYFFNAFSHALNIASRHKDRKVWLLYLDLDGFKAINDNIGHDAGDEILKQVSAELLKITRNGDTVARLGGDEFTIVLENRTDQAEITPLIDRIRDSIGAISHYKTIQIDLSVSIGIAEFSKDGNTITQLMNVADQRMYRDKRLRKSSANNDEIPHPSQLSAVKSIS